MPELAARIRRKLEAALSPSFLDIVDESHLHAGHAGARPSGESHFFVDIAAPALAALNRVEAQRRVYDILREEMAGTIHALRLNIRR
ncbi:MAG TPA: BolA family protein [Dongiaceae bacterium]|nr:BolA family protein [Dongiaceae bacterium]